jgi:hypothetical protein
MYVCVYVHTCSYILIPKQFLNIRHPSASGRANAVNYSKVRTTRDCRLGQIIKGAERHLKYPYRTCILGTDYNYIPRSPCSSFSSPLSCSFHVSSSHVLDFLPSSSQPVTTSSHPTLPAYLTKITKVAKLIIYLHIYIYMYLPCISGHVACTKRRLSFPHSSNHKLLYDPS